jgi:hypothetical protein
MENFPTKIAANTDAKAARAPQHSVRFIAGTVLMAASFLVYPAYPVILLWLPLSPSVKAGVSVAVWVLSWGSFSLGAYLAGPEGYAWFKGLWRRLIGNRSRNQPGRKTFSDP